MYISLVKCKSKKYLFHAKSCWQNFSWNKIHLRIFMLVKQILIETKKHNLNNVYKLQNYLINSNELKIFELNKIMSKVYFFYYKKEKKKHINTNKFKLELINNIFDVNTLKTEDFTLIKKKLKENLIYACIKPVYQARSTKFINKYKNLSNLDCYINNNKYYYYSSNKFMIKKLKQYSYIKKLIANFLHTNSCLDIHEIFYSKKTLNLNQLNYSLNLFDTIKDNNLLCLLNQIILHDSTWHNFSQLKKEKNLMTLKSKKLYNIKPNHTSIFKSFKIYLRLFFTIKKSRIFKHILLKTVDSSLFRKLIQLYQNWYCKIKPFVSININNICNICINHLIYIWIKKKKSLHYNIMRLIYIINAKLNKFVYLSNINKYYTNYYYLAN
uniref:Reverse transcriptase N-terminal domain-containing protein n=1 Tax=Vertebrata isogona TaxID=2006944 RepID=A0A1Z1MEN3_9FLOR|nr:hypothetical protein [Vertebrata isogona]ARW64500.1 hypothetical protein [Vertebrata isogona]